MVRLLDWDEDGALAALREAGEEVAGRQLRPASSPPQPSRASVSGKEEQIPIYLTTFYGFYWPRALLARSACAATSVCLER